MARRQPSRDRLGPTRAATLQGFRSDFPWLGTLGRRFAQIGNAVCPPIARAVLAEAMQPSLVLEGRA